MAQVAGIHKTKITKHTFGSTTYDVAAFRVKGLIGDEPETLMEDLKHLRRRIKRILCSASSSAMPCSVSKPRTPREPEYPLLNYVLTEYILKDMSML